MAAVTPLNCTVGVPTLKFAPAIVTLVPTAPVIGEKPKMVGCTTKLFVVNSDPAGVKTRIGPVVAPMGATARIAPLLRTVKLGASKLLKNRTAIAPRKLVPLMITFVPARPFVGEKPVMVSGP